METFPGTIPELLAWRGARVASASTRGRDGARVPWLFFEDQSWTLEDVLDQVDRHAVGLAERGVAPGDRVAILLGNCPETLFSWFAANRLGAIAAPLNPAYKPFELAGIVRLLRPRVMVVDELRGLAEAGCAAVDVDVRPTLVSPRALAAAGTGAPRFDVRPDDVCVLLATSGTTGAPKAVMQTHRTYTLSAEAFPFWLDLDASDRLLVALPLFHINAQAYSVMGALGAGASLAIMPRFSAARFWDNARALGGTQFNAVGAMVHILLKGEPRASDRDHHVRKCYTALALPEPLHQRFEQRFGLSMSVGYGMSETIFGTVWPRDHARRYGTMGLLRQHPRLGEVNRGRVVKDDGAEAAIGETGELWLQNSGTMRGYWDDEAATSLALQDGWLHTGDLVTRDAEAFYTFVSRKKEVLRRRGENVTAAEIEGVLLGHPTVREAAVVGEPSDLGEDEIVAYVSAQEGATIDVDALRAWVGAHLADFKVPSRVLVRDALPRTPTERIAKHLLK